MIILKIIVVAFLTWLFLEIVEETIKTIRRNRIAREMRTQFDILIAQDEFEQGIDNFISEIKREKKAKKTVPSKKKTTKKKSR